MSDPVNSPSHYKSASGLECIDVIEAFGLNFHRASALKYLIRAGRKSPAKTVEDLRKSIWMIEREILRIQSAEDDKVASESTARAMCSTCRRVDLEWKGQWSRIDDAVARNVEQRWMCNACIAHKQFQHANADKNIAQHIADEKKKKRGG